MVVSHQVGSLGNDDACERRRRSAVASNWLSVVTGAFPVVSGCGTNLPGRMTDDMMNSRALVEKSADTDLLGKMIGFAAERLKEMEVGAAIGAGYGEKNPLPFKIPKARAERD